MPSIGRDLPPALGRHGHDRTVHQKAVLGRHEGRVAAPVRADHRQAARHRLQIRTAPTFAPARQHEGIARLVERHQLRPCPLLLDKLHAPVGQKVEVHLLPNVIRRLLADLLGRVAQRRPDLQHERDLFPLLERLQERPQQHIPSLVQRPVEHRQQHKRPSGSCVYRCGRISDRSCACCVLAPRPPILGEAIARGGCMDRVRAGGKNEG